MLAMQTDRTLETSGQTCKDKFEKIENDLYAGDANCATMIQRAMNGNTDEECPEGLGGSKSGSQVQKCMSKSEVGNVGTSVVNLTANISELTPLPLYAGDC
jgi:hypothetical protein